MGEENIFEKKNFYEYSANVISNKAVVYTISKLNFVRLFQEHEDIE